jgi:hypothetical protein
MTTENLAAEQILNQMKEEIKQLQQQNLYLNERIEGLKVTSATAVGRGTYAPTTTIKLNKPMEYTGDRNTTKVFIAQNELIFTSQPYEFQSDQTKILYLASFLRGNAFHWYFNTNNRGQIPGDYKQFIELFTHYFGQQNEEMEATQRIQNLYQTSSVSKYNQAFNKLSILIDYNENALITLYRKGLKDKVKDLLLACDRPKSILNLQDKCLEIDDRIMEDQHFKNTQNPTQFNKHKSNTNWNHKITSPIAKEDRYQAMEIDNVQVPRILHYSKKNPKFGPLSQEDKDLRKKKGLCIYCGSSTCGGTQDTNNCSILLKRKNTNKVSLNGTPSS